MYIHISKPEEDVWGCVHEALQRGAAAVIAGEAFEAEEDIEVPVMLLPDCLDAQQRLAIGFYENPSTKMTVVGVTGKLLSLLLVSRWSHSAASCKIACKAAAAIQVRLLCKRKGVQHSWSVHDR